MSAKIDKLSRVRNAIKLKSNGVSTQVLPLVKVGQNIVVTGDGNCECHKSLISMCKLPFEIYREWAQIHTDLLVDVYAKRFMISDIFDGEDNYELLSKMSRECGPISMRHVIVTVYYTFK